MPRYLLDTNILSDLMKSPQGVVAQTIASLPAEDQDTLATSIVVAAELRYGAAKKGSRKLTDRVEQLLEAIDVLPLEADADRRYATTRMELERAGKIIGGNDLLIGAQALSLGAVLVTDNIREFGRIKGLIVKNWLRV
jgi:tRNA(fMet)-specific endonuclease VapC